MQHECSDREKITTLQPLGLLPERFSDSPTSVLYVVLCSLVRGSVTLNVYMISLKIPKYSSVVIEKSLLNCNLSVRYCNLYFGVYFERMIQMTQMYQYSDREKMVFQPLYLDAERLNDFHWESQPMYILYVQCSLFRIVQNLR